jgi:hypothetical protein
MNNYILRERLKSKKVKIIALKSKNDKLSSEKVKGMNL